MYEVAPEENNVAVESEERNKIRVNFVFVCVRDFGVSAHLRPGRQSLEPLVKEGVDRNERSLRVIH